MAGTPKGSVVLRSVPNHRVAEGIAAYLCRFFRSMPYEGVRTLVRKRKPLTLLEDISAEEGSRIVAEINRLGASAFFLRNPP